jgi:hypothetical protein
MYSPEEIEKETAKTVLKDVLRFTISNRKTKNQNLEKPRSNPKEKPKPSPKENHHPNPLKNVQANP